MDRLPNTGFIDFTGYCNDLRLVLGGAGAVDSFLQLQCGTLICKNTYSTI